MYRKRVEEIKNSELEKYDYIIDAVDNIESKIYMVKLAKKLSIPLLHGACGGWYGQVGWILPGCNLLEDIYQNKNHGLEQDLKNPSFTPSLVASIMVSEFVKMIKKSDVITTNELLLIDCYNNVIMKSHNKD